MAFLIPENLKSRTDVPNGIRQAATALQMGLEENSTVWYEPLYDPSGEMPHLVVLIPQVGVSVLEVMEVDADGVLGPLKDRVRFVSSGKERDAENPLRRATRLATALNHFVAAEPRLLGLKIPIGAVAVFPNLTRAAAQPYHRSVAPEQCLFREDLEAARRGETDAALLRVFARLIGDVMSVEVTDDLEKVLRGLIQPNAVIDRVVTTSPPGSQAEVEELTIFQPPEGEEDVVRVMDRKQEALAKSLGDGHRIVRGVAGSGKTLVLVYRARLLARLWPKHPFLVTCYTRALASQLQVLLADYDNVDVRTMDKLMARAIRDAGMTHPGYDGGDGEAVVEMALQAVQLGGGPRYRAIMVDEGQDFAPAHLQFVRGLLCPPSEELLIVLDGAQNIFRRRFSLKQAGINAQGRSRILRVNYRNTREILDFASRFLLAAPKGEASANPPVDADELFEIVPPESACRHGEPPSLRRLGRGERLVDAVVESVRASLSTQRKAREVAVLYTYWMPNEVDRLRRSLLEAGIEAFWGTDPKDGKAKERIGSAAEPVILCTVQSAKGLEFPRVVLLAASHPSKGTEANRMAIYVGMTRATDRLTVLVHDGDPLASELAGAQWVV